MRAKVQTRRLEVFIYNSVVQNKKPASKRRGLQIAIAPGFKAHWQFEGAIIREMMCPHRENILGKN
jgi:hypothetical protein